MMKCNACTWRPWVMIKNSLIKTGDKIDRIKVYERSCYVCQTQEWKDEKSVD